MFRLCLIYTVFSSQMKVTQLLECVMYTVKTVFIKLQLTLRELCFKISFLLKENNGKTKYRGFFSRFVDFLTLKSFTI